MNGNRFSIRMVGRLGADLECCSVSGTGESARCPFTRYSLTTLSLIPRSNAAAACFSVRRRCLLPWVGTIAKTSQSRVVMRRRGLGLVDGGSCLFEFLLNLVQIDEGVPNLLRQNRVLLQEVDVWLLDL